VTAPTRLLLALLLTVLIIGAYLLVPHSSEYTRATRQFTHTPRGSVTMVVTVILFAATLKLILVDLWDWFERRRRH